FPWSESNTTELDFPNKTLTPLVDIEVIPQPTNIRGIISK
ncbi:6725_t:CDS:1, partial [Entrophospora sp. SA101]